MIFYGSTPYGKRIHIGNWISPRQRARENFVYTFCGSEMTSWEEGERPPREKVDSFCKTCFRQAAWQVFVMIVTSETLEELGPDYNEFGYRKPKEKLLDNKARHHV